MNKRELVNAVAEKANITRIEARDTLEALIESVEDVLVIDGKISLKGFGSFQLKKRASRKVRSPRTGEIITLPPARVPHFKPGKSLKDILNPEGKVIEDNGERKMTETAAAENAKVVESGSTKRTGQARVIAVTSGKGGTGKTNFVINTAIALARRGLKVCIIDADLGTANVDILLGLQCRKTINDLVANRAMRLSDIMVEGPEGITLIPGGSGLQSLAELPEEELGRIIGVFKKLEETADVILIDTGSGISRNVVEFAVAADEVVVVATPEPHALSDAYAIIKVISTREMRPPIKVVFNLVESLNEARLVSSRLQDVTGRFLGFCPEVIGHVFKDETLVKAVKLFKPVVLYNPISPASRCFFTIADSLVPPPKPMAAPAPVEQRGFFGKLKNLFEKASSSGGPREK